MVVLHVILLILHCCITVRHCADHVTAVTVH